MQEQFFKKVKKRRAKKNHARSDATLKTAETAERSNKNSRFQHFRLRFISTRWQVKKGGQRVKSTGWKVGFSKSGPAPFFFVLFPLRRALQSAPCLIRSTAFLTVFNSMKSREIDCTTCGETTLARVEPVYEGFRKTGEAFICTGCGARYASAEETPFVCADTRPQVFTEADKTNPLSVFRDEERRRSCGWCKHFVVNPFSQRCGLSNKETQATELCVRFEKKAEPSPDKGAAGCEPTAPGLL